MPDMMSVQGCVFNIQSYCLHDGPGIRSTVFLKGCPLTCRWCQNPESQSPQPQLLFYGSKCAACGACARRCPHDAIHWVANAKPKTDRGRCTACGACVSGCPSAAREIVGKTMSVGDVCKQVLSDKMFFDGSGGGLTISGGEPLMQPAFTAALLQAAQAAGLLTCIETCNFAPQTILDQIYPHVDLALCDIKHMDTNAHHRITGVPNGVILENLRYIRRVLGRPMCIRVPVVPGYNGDMDAIAAIARFVAGELGTDVPLHLLPYHRTGESKRQSLETPGRELQAAPPSELHMAECAALARSFGLVVHIGG